jgi:hypothetical protein
MAGEECAPPMDGKMHIATMTGMWLISQVLGYYGAALVIYSFVASISSPWPPLEHVAPLVSSILTILGLLVTASSIYLPQMPYCAPWPLSRWVVAPLVIMSCVLAIALLIIQGRLSPVLINGFAMLGLSGGLLRILQIDVRKII